MSSRCSVLAWDSEFFGHRIARLDGSHLHDEDVNDVFAWCRAGQIECLYFLAASDCPETLSTAERHGFGWKDLRVTYEGACAPFLKAPASAVVKVRPHRESDVAPLAVIARGAHTDSRFFFDTRFDRPRAADLYERWIREACAHDHVFVAECNGQPVGYLSVKREGEIGLLAVAQEFQGRGIAGTLLASGMQWFADQGTGTVRVVTQGRNTAAQRFYQNAGFRTRSVECWFHKWFDP